MTINELIEKLQAMPQEAVVVFAENKFSSYEFPISSVCNTRDGNVVVLYSN